MNATLRVVLLAGILSLPVTASQAAEETAVRIVIQADRPSHRINPAMWGIFFEDINLGADGGLYAELVKNRSFEFPNPFMGWSTELSPGGQGTMMVSEEAPFHPANPHYLRLEGAGIAVVNEGFRGIGVREGESYRFSAQVRSPGRTPKAVRIELVAANGRTVATARISKFTSNWQKHTATLRASATDPKARLKLVVEGRGTVDLDMVSLFPEKTWKNRPNGLRADLVQALADLKPGFMRFPGGCIVEGHWLTNRYQWKTTIGDPAERTLIINRWNDEFKHRATPDYFQSFGLGFFEYFQLCEDLGAEPLPILNCGMACQFNSGELAPLDQLEPYIQDALDLIEFANGPATSKWGRRRAEMGHPEPFHLKMLGIGNEQWGQQYIDRYVRFAQVLKEKHPEIALVSSAGPSPSDSRFQFLWEKLRALGADLVDEHSYAPPAWFFDAASRYDDYPRTGPKVCMGEYAAHTRGRENNLEAALAEAAFMTGMERNADVVRLASYAPLLAHADGWQWKPDLIWFDNLRVCPTPNYYVQQMFSRNRGDVVLPLQLTGPEGPTVPSGRIGLCTYRTDAEFKNVVVSRNGERLFVSNFETAPSEWQPEGGRWSVVNGAYRQSDANAVTAAFAGERGWRDYTLSLKARKLGGAEGFIIIVRNQGQDSQVQWNLGGWGNKQHGIQALRGGRDVIIERIPGSIETGRWYDIRIELNGSRLKCYLDGTLLQTADVPPPQPRGVFATSCKDEKTGEILLKVVNPTPQDVVATVQIDGASRLGPRGEATILTGNGPADENTLDEPDKVAPARTAIDALAPEFEYAFKAWSLTVLRLPMAK